MNHVGFLSFGMTAEEFGLLIIIAFVGLFGGRSIRILSAVVLVALCVIWFPDIFLKIGFFCAIMVALSELFSLIKEKVKTYMKRLFSRPLPLVITIVIAIMAGAFIYFR